ncbi:retrovirus-related pol polyprotein from transposon TNT 1-94 [Tanacetum coccineum]
MSSSNTSSIKKDFNPNNVHLTKEQISAQKKIEEEAKAETAKRKGEIRKEEFIDLLGPEVVNKKGLITLKVYREDDTSKIIPEFKASDLHLGEWREVVTTCPNKKGKGWTSIYKQIQERMDYLRTTEVELGIDLDRPLSEQDPFDRLNDLFEMLKFLQHQLFRSLEDWEVSSLQCMQWREKDCFMPKGIKQSPLENVLLKSAEKYIRFSSKDCTWLKFKFEGDNTPIVIQPPCYSASKKKRFLCHIIGIEPQFENIISNGPFVPMAAGQRKPEAQWTADERKAANLDQRLKSLIMSVLPDDQMNSVINCLTAKSTWDDLILYHEGPSDVKESRVMDLKLCYNTFKFKEGESLTQTFTRYKALMNELVNDGIKLSKLEINTGFINGLPKKWLSFCQSLRNTNHVKDSELASLFGKLKYEENLIDSIYETEKSKSLVSATPLSTAFFSTSIVQDFQDSPDDEEDTRSSHEYLNDLEEEYQAKALLAKSKRFFKKGTQRFSSAKATDQTECHKCGKKGHFARDCWSKTSVPSYQSPFQPKLLLSSENKPEMRNTKDFEAKYNKDEEELSSDDEEIEVTALMAFTDEERIFVGKESVRNGEWTKITIKKVHTLLEMEDNDDRKSFLDYLCIYLNYVEEQRNNLSSKHRNIVQELNACKEQLLCINEQIPTQKKKILGIRQLIEDTSSCGSKGLVFVKSSPDNSDMSISSSNLHKSSKAEDSTLPNHDTDEVPSNKSHINTTDPSVVVSDSPASDYDSADESLVCSTPLLPLKKLDGVEPGSGPKTVKSILKSKSTFKAETLKGITLNEPSLAHARGNKSSLASKTNSAPTGKLKNVKVEDDPPLAMVMKELNELKLQISKKKSSYSRNKNTQQVPLNALQNKYKTQFKMNCELCGQNNQIFENCYEVLFCKNAKEQITKLVIMLNLCPPYIQISIILVKVNLPQDPYLQDPQYLFPSCKHWGHNNHHSDDCSYYPTCEICRSYDHNTHDHNRIISQRRGINLRNPEHVIKIVKHLVAMFILPLMTMTLSGLRKEKLLMPRKLNHQML